MKPNIPYICEGEIYEVQEHVSVSRKPIRYVCRVGLPDGSAILVPNCIQSTMFGGIDDYLQFRSRASIDSGADTETNYDDEKNSAQVGDRVLVAFIGGNIQKPMIIGYAPHPNQTYEFEDEDPREIDPQLVMKYLGIKLTVDDEGQLRLTHGGAPEIAYKPRSSGILALPGGSENVAVTPQPKTETTTLEFLKGGVFRLKDADGQVIEIDRTQKRILLSNNNVKSTDEEEGPLSPDLDSSEYLLLDKGEGSSTLHAQKEARIISKGDRNDKTEVDVFHEIGKNNTRTVGKDEVAQITGDQETSINGKQILKVTGNRDEAVKGNWTVKVEGNIDLTASGSAFLKMGGGKVTFGGPTAELLDLVYQVLQQMDTLLTQLQAETHPTAVGPSGPPVNAAAYGAIQAQLKTIATLLEGIKG